jgi:hypothetical protein
VGLLRYLNPLRILDAVRDAVRRIEADGVEPEQALEDATSPADRVTSAEEEAEDRSRDERAEVLQDEAERLEEAAARPDAEDARELREATDRAVAERRTVERD